MADQFCPHCGTEVDADARFCPTCGRALPGEPEQPDEFDVPATATHEPDADETSAIPPAPAWLPPEPSDTEEPEEPKEAHPPSRAEEEEEAAVDAPIPVVPPPTAPAGEPPAGERPAPHPAAAGPRDGSALPFTVLVMLSGWLIGAGSGFAALALLPRLGSLVNVLLFLALLWVAATVFLADRLPSFPQQRLAVLVVVMVATGAALDRSGFRVNVNSIFLVAILVAAAGVLLLELGRDRPAQTGRDR